ncbi:dihydroorotate dehydrogenase electron transfer subunit [Enhygromyxa salina]|uniref:dihydroorotate dehydrogenase electron transfer subunit n=1 Tax=Enhygromyxa salina TaxID=215803 RepID=UPI0011BABF5E|nr:dihydroorotate dehydrogenase electron transfer subunit [Enhygromyxa salina]
MVTTQFQVEIAANRRLTGGYFVLELASERANPVADATPGQFVMLRGDWGRDLLNGRAFSVLEPIDRHRFSVLLKVFGRGTALMQDMPVGAPMTVTGPLGQGFPAPTEGRTQLLVAGGVGLPPLHFLARTLAATKAPTPEMFYGGRTADDLVLTDDLERWGIPTVLATEDGSRGVHGRVTAPLLARIELAQARAEPVELLACGPTPMLRALREIGLAHEIPTYLCLEEMMACGFGVCLGCAVPVYGDKPYKYCCTDGPVFEAAQVRW